MAKIGLIVAMPLAVSSSYQVAVPDGISLEDIPNLGLDANLTANLQYCLKGIQKYRPDMKLCADPAQHKLADTMAAYDNVHGAHAYVKDHPDSFLGPSAACHSGNWAGQNECTMPADTQEAADNCFKAYYDEGPPVPPATYNHRTTMLDTRVKCIACGFAAPRGTQNYCMDATGGCSMAGHYIDQNGTHWVFTQTSSTEITAHNADAGTDVAMKIIDDHTIQFANGCCTGTYQSDCNVIKWTSGGVWKRSSDADTISI